MGYSFLPSSVQYTISEDFGPNLLSLYDPGDPDPIFQIDANLGFPGAVLVGFCLRDRRLLHVYVECYSPSSRCG